VAGGLAAAGLLAARRQRLALAGRAAEIERRAVAGLGVPASSTMRTGDGVSLHAIEAGPEDGPLALLLHGFPDCWYGWSRQIPALVGMGYRVVALDQRGYNLSEKPRDVSAYGLDRLTADIVAVLHDLGRQKAVVVGHDWGGIVAWRLAMDYPQAVDRLIILNAPHPRAIAREMKKGGLQRLRSSYILFFQLPWLPEALLTMSPRATARFMFEDVGTQSSFLTDEDVEILAAAMAQPGAMTGALNWYRAAAHFPPARRTSDIQQPTLVLWGTADPALGIELTEGLGSWVPALRLRYFPGVGHWVHLEAAAAVSEEIAAFLAGAWQEDPAAGEGEPHGSTTDFREAGASFPG
jgi:pimeloyl-ACP methyl ester carboxylesterase